jgi:hypothetical protein
MNRKAGGRQAEGARQLGPRALLRRNGSGERQSTKRCGPKAGFRRDEPGKEGDRNAPVALGVLKYQPVMLARFQDADVWSFDY